MSTRENIRLIARTPYSPGAKNGLAPGGHMFYIGLYKENVKKSPV